MSRTIAIVGAGFCGTLAAVHLLRAPVATPLHVILIDSAEPGRGVAYGTAERTHLLNVPAGGMSAFADDEQGFLRFAKQRQSAASGGDFLPRQLYGDYLQALLREAVAQRSSPIEFTVLRSRAVDIETQRGVDDVDVQALLLDTGEKILADRVILALGNAQSADPPLADPAFYRDSRRYLRDPWSPDFLRAIDWQQPALLLGTGLTAVDVALRLRAQQFQQPLIALSRRGLTPLAHRGLSVKAADIALPEDLIRGIPSARASLHAARRYAAALEHADGDGDWRNLIATLRAHTPRLWQQCSEREQRRFLRHGSIYWDVHRHRLAPAVAAALNDLLLSRKLTIGAARIESLHDDGAGVQVRLRRRGQRRGELLRVGTVINCTGPNGNIVRNGDPLPQALLRRGVLVADKLKLGVEVADDYALIDREGRASSSVFYVGPLLKAKFWEATAVPELRVHVADAVASVLASL